MSRGKPVFVSVLYSPKTRMRLGSVHSLVSCPREEISGNKKSQTLVRAGHVTASWVVAGIDRVTILSLYQSAVYNVTKYRRLRLSCCNKLLSISQLPSSF